MTKIGKIWIQDLIYANKVFETIYESTPTINWDNLQSSTCIYMILVDEWGQKIGIFGPKSDLNCEYWNVAAYLGKQSH